MKSRRIKIIRQVVFASMTLYCFPVLLIAAPATSDMWTLQRSIRRALSIAPEVKIARAAIRSQQGNVDKAGEWPNPTVSIRVENNIRQISAQSGYTIDQLTVAQALPLRRLPYQRHVAREGMLAVQAGAIQVRRDIEASVARHFLALQISHEKLRLARQQRRFTQKLIHLLQHSKEPNGIVRYVSPLGYSRLRLLNETVEQHADAAANNYQESLYMFRNYLLLPPEQPIGLPPMQPIVLPPRHLLQQLAGQAPKLRSLKHQVKAARAGVKLQRVLRFKDPVLTYNREKNVNNYNQVFSFNGVMLTFSLPLWDQNHGNIVKAQAAVVSAESRVELAQRRLNIRLRRDHMQLEHLLAQANHFRQDILPSSRKVLNDTRRNYTVGAVNTLTMIDAYNAYFNASSHYLDLQFAAHQQIIDLSQALGQSLLAKADAIRSRP